MSEMANPGDEPIDAPSTLLGQLQRGLGRGYLTALRGKAGRDELLRCIVRDPRWDRQVEERASYYAQLAVELDVSVPPIAAAVRRGDPTEGEGALSADVLAEMALRGRGDALAALRTELRHEGWLLALEALEGAESEHGEELLRREDLGVIAGHDPDEPRGLFFDTALPWRRWATVEPSLHTLLESVNAGGEPEPRPPALRPDTAMSTSELLSIAEPRNGVKVARVLAERRDGESVAALIAAAQGDDRDQRLAAFRALGAQGNATLLDRVTDLFEADPGGPTHGARRPAMLRYVEALPPELTLPRARAWLGQSGGAAIAAQGILARHAQPEDRGLVEETLSAALDEDPPGPEGCGG